MSSQRYIPYAELTQRQRERVDSASPAVRAAAARDGLGLDVLVLDATEDVRSVVAAKHYGLSRLVFDKASMVRAAVAGAGYGLDMLASDPAWAVRRTAAAALASQGKGHDLASWIAENPDKCALSCNQERTARRSAAYAEPVCVPRARASTHRTLAEDAACAIPDRGAQAPSRATCLRRPI